MKHLGHSAWHSETKTDVSYVEEFPMTVERHSSSVTFRALHSECKQVEGYEGSPSWAKWPLKCFQASEVYREAGVVVRFPQGLPGISK